MRNDARRAVVLLLLPACGLYALLFLYPVASSLVLSLYDWDGFTQHRQFVGLGNFSRLLTDDPMFWTALKHNLFFLSVPTAVILVTALFFAAALSSDVWGARFFRITYFFPNIISMVAITLLWFFIYNPNFGLLNGVLGKLTGGKVSIVWLDPNHIMGSLVAPIVWCSLGFYLILFLAGMENIPQTYYDAAKVDGANAWQQFRSITVPLLWDVITMAVVFLIIGGLRIFDLIYVMALGYPNEQSQVIATYLYEQAFNNAHMGYGIAIAVVLFVLVFAATSVAMRIMRREQLEY
ncbi:MAG: sugar ABC transporter permease [Armatimonadota bacterium]|nr:MAG: sugar ABC transporter permease [Armatimonadota bacterium]